MEGARLFRLRTKLEAAAKRADDNFPANEYLRVENGEPGVETLTAQTQTGGVCSGWNSSLLNVVAVEIIDALSDTEHRAELESLLRSHFGDWSSSPL